MLQEILIVIVVIALIVLVLKLIKSFLKIAFIVVLIVLGAWLLVYLREDPCKGVGVESSPFNYTDGFLSSQMTYKGISKADFLVIGEPNKTIEGQALSSSLKLPYQGTPSEVIMVPIAKRIDKEKKCAPITLELG